MRFTSRTSILILLSLATFACGEDSRLGQVQQLEDHQMSRQSLNDGKQDEAQQELYTYADIQLIWDQKCVSCHSYDAGYPAADLSLEIGDSEEALVDVYSLQAYDLPLVAPGDLETSYLWQKLNDQQYDVYGSGDAMPPSYISDDFQLTSKEFALIEAWILQGAGQSFVLNIEPSDEPIEPTDEPVEPTDEPVEPTDEPVEPTDEPVEPTDEPVEPSDEPVEPSDEPVEPSDEPVEPSDEPVEPSDEPVEPSDEPVEPSVNYEQVQAIYNGACTSCHGEPGLFGASGGLSLADGYSYEATVNVSSSQQRNGMYLITPGAPEESYLWHKLNDTHNEVGGSGRGMSPGFFGYNSLPQAELDLIETWILSGAQP